MLVLRAPSRTIVGGQAFFDGIDVLVPLAGCLVPGVLPTRELADEWLGQLRRTADVARTLAATLGRRTGSRRRGRPRA